MYIRVHTCDFAKNFGTKHCNLTIFKMFFQNMVIDFAFLAKIKI